MRLQSHALRDRPTKDSQCKCKFVGAQICWCLWNHDRVDRSVDQPSDNNFCIGRTSLEFRIETCFGSCQLCACMCLTMEMRWIYFRRTREWRERSHLFYYIITIEWLRHCGNAWARRRCGSAAKINYFLVFVAIRVMRARARQFNGSSFHWYFNDVKSSSSPWSIQPIACSCDRSRHSNRPFWILRRTNRNLLYEN